MHSVHDERQLSHFRERLRPCFGVRGANVAQKMKPRSNHALSGFRGAEFHAPSARATGRIGLRAHPVSSRQLHREGWAARADALPPDGMRLGCGANLRSGGCFWGESGFFHQTIEWVKIYSKKAPTRFGWPGRRASVHADAVKLDHDATCHGVERLGVSHSEIASLRIHLLGD